MTRTSVIAWSRNLMMTTCLWIVIAQVGAHPAIVMVAAVLTAWVVVALSWGVFELMREVTGDA